MRKFYHLGVRMSIDFKKILGRFLRKAMTGKGLFIHGEQLHVLRRRER